MSFARTLLYGVTMMKIAPRLLLLPLASITLWSCNQPNGKPVNPYANGVQHPWRQAQADAPALTNGFLSDQNWVSASGGWGPVAKDASNGEQYEETSSASRLISIGGKQYTKGLGTHAASSIVYKLSAANDCTMFKVVVGLDDEIRTQSEFGSVIFQVWMDGMQVWNSQRLTVTGNSTSETVNLPVTGTKTLELRVTDGGDDLGYDHADWADAQIECGVAAPPASSTKIQFEDFKQGGEGVGYHDNDPQNQGGLYRPNEGVDLDKRGDADGYEIGWSGPGEWMKYDLSTAAGRYDLSIRYGTWKAGEALDIFVDDTKVLTAEFPNISSLDAHQVIKAGTVNLTAGAHVVKVAYVGQNPGINLDWMEFAPVGGPTPPPPAPPSPTPPPAPPSPTPPPPAPPSPTPPPPSPTPDVPPSIRQIYVSSSGNDGNSGTIDQPLRTVQRGLDAATPGTAVVLRGGNYPEPVTFSNSGTEGAWITLQSQPGERAVLGNTTVPKFASFMTMTDRQYILIKDITVSNISGELPLGISVNGASHHIQIRNNTVTGIYHTTSLPFSRGISVGNSRPDVSAHDIIIANNEVSDMPGSIGELIAVSGNVENSQVIGNQVSKIDLAIGIDILGNYDGIDGPNGFARDILVADNTLRDGGQKDGIYSICLYIDGAQRVTMERNRVFTCGYNAQVLSENSPQTKDDQGQYGVDNRDNIFRDNLLVNCLTNCLTVGGYSGAHYGTSYNTSVTNNTLVSNGSVITLNLSDGTRFANNIFVSQSGGFIANNGGAQNVSYSHNLWFGGSGSNPTPDVNSMYIDPLLDGSSFRLLSGSPAIDRGDSSVLSSGERDADGNPRVAGSGVDIGAFER